MSQQDRARKIYLHQSISDRRFAKIKRTAQNRQSGLMVVMEDVYNPYNLNAIARSCDAFGVQTIAVVFDDQPEFDPREEGQSSAVSAQKWVDYRIFNNGPNKAYRQLQAEGWHLLATVADSTMPKLYEVDLTMPKLAVLVGNEHEGLSDETIALADTRITIPMSGMIESFNVSVATAITLYEISRQRAASGRDYSLSDDTIEELITQYIGQATRTE